MRSSILFFIAALFLVGLALSAQGEDCRKFFIKNQEYSLSSLMSYGALQASSSTSDYVFGICQQIKNPCGGCKDGYGGCMVTKGNTCVGVYDDKFYIDVEKFGDQMGIRLIYNRGEEKECPSYMNAEFAEYLDLTEQNPEVGVPNTPDVQVPNTPDVQVPNTPDVQVPSTPDVQVPSTPDVQVPSTPDVQVPIIAPEEPPMAPRKRYHSMIVNIICSEVTTGKPEIITAVTPDCPGSTHTITFAHAAGCPIPVKGLSAGSIMLIIIFVTFAVYLIGGVLIKIFIKKEQGAHIIPNYHFWTDLPSLIKDGFVFIKNKITGQSAENKGYSTFSAQGGYQTA